MARPRFYLPVSEIGYPTGEDLAAFRLATCKIIILCIFHFLASHTSTPASDETLPSKSKTKICACGKAKCQDDWLEAPSQRRMQGPGWQLWSSNLAAGALRTFFAHLRSHSVIQRMSPANHWDPGDWIWGDVCGH